GEQLAGGDTRGIEYGPHAHGLPPWEWRPKEAEWTYAHQQTRQAPNHLPGLLEHQVQRAPLAAGFQRADPGVCVHHPAVREATDELVPALQFRERSFANGDSAAGRRGRAIQCGPIDAHHLFREEALMTATGCAPGPPPSP